MRPPKRYRNREPVFDAVAYRRMDHASRTQSPLYWRIVYEELVHLSEQRVSCGYSPLDMSPWPEGER